MFPTRVTRSDLTLAANLAQREFLQRYSNSLTGPLWAFAQPLLMVAVYAVVFVGILRVRFPETTSTREALPYLIAALWPWAAFAESISRSVSVIPENAALLAKVAIPRTILAITPIVVTFGVQLVGLAIVAVVGMAFGHRYSAAGIGLALLGWIGLAAFSVGLGLTVAASAVFIRDLGQLIPQILTLFFFLTPIFYTREMVPEHLSAIIVWNPVAPFIDLIRRGLIAPSTVELSTVIAVVLLSTIAVVFGLWWFNRLADAFEDFL